MRKYQVVQVQANKNAKFAFRLNRFLFVDMLFFRVRQNNRLFLVTFEFAALIQFVALLFFYRDFTKLATCVTVFVLVASAVATAGPGAPYPPLTTACDPPFRFTQNAYLEHHVRTRQQAIMEKGIMFKDNSHLKFSPFFAKLLATNI